MCNLFMSSGTTEFSARWDSELKTNENIGFYNWLYRNVFLKIWSESTMSSNLKYNADWERKPEGVGAMWTKHTFVSHKEYILYWPIPWKKNVSDPQLNTLIFLNHTL